MTVANGAPDPGLFRQYAAAEESAQVECQGLTFDSEEAHRKHFLARLQEKPLAPRPTVRPRRAVSTTAASSNIAGGGSGLMLRRFGEDSGTGWLAQVYQR